MVVVKRRKLRVMAVWLPWTKMRIMVHGVLATLPEIQGEVGLGLSGVD